MARRSRPLLPQLYPRLQRFLGHATPQIVEEILNDTMLVVSRKASS